MTSHELKLLGMGARLFAKQVMARAELREEQAQQQRLREERARAFWDEVDGVAAVLRWPGREAE